MNLFQLSLGCFLYSIFTNFDKSYRDFLNEVDGNLDLEKSNHRKSLITWLNSWGCRQFAVKYHEFASENVRKWYIENKNLIPNDKAHLWNLTDTQILNLHKAYTNLELTTVSYKNRPKGRISVTAGPTGASKALFALRPNVAIPWDIPIRDHLKKNLKITGYLDFLNHAKTTILNLQRDIEKKDWTLEMLPERIGRPNSTLTKLIDEYYWVTITRKCEIPTEAQFRKLIGWQSLYPS